MIQSMTGELGAMQSPAAADARGRQTLVRDAAIVFFATLLAAVLCVRFDFSEALFHWTRSLERLQFDELPAILLVFACGFLWFAARRYREAGAMLVHQRSIDVRLFGALAENRRLAQQYLSVQESERKNLARELHDELGQYLNAIKIDAVSIRDSKGPSVSEIHSASIAITRNVDHVYTVVTELIRRLRPVGLDELGLVAAIEHCIDQWRTRLPAMEIKLSVAGEFVDLSEQANLTAYRIAQESLTNAAKHSSATRVDIELTRCNSVAGEKQVSVRIADNGVGADLTSEQGGFGLVSMRERVEMQGGSFEVLSRAGQGFSLRATFPTDVHPSQVNL